MVEAAIVARVSRKRALLFFAADALKVAALAGAAAYIQHPIAVGAAVVWSAVLGFFVWKRLQTTGLGGSLELG